ncbi:MAG: hypothetical protein ABW069_14550 [Duganella sp.]
MSYPTKVEPSETFRVTFRSYVTFSVSLEHFFPPEADAEFEGEQFLEAALDKALKFDR